MYKLISFLLVAFLLSSCATKKSVEKKESLVETKTLVEKYTDTVFYTPKSATSFGIPINSIAKCIDVKGNFNAVSKEETKPQIFTQKNGNAKATVKIVHDSIFIHAECDSLAIAAKIKSVYANNDRNREASESTKEKKQLNIFTIIGMCAVCLIGGFVAGKLI